MTQFDVQMMRRAIALAPRGEGRVEPNPMVGCVVVKGGRIIGEGFHRRFGGPHAEIEALRSCRQSPRGATVYVSLEPCCHVGKTQPCTTALIDAGVGGVVAAIRDPSSKVNGRGIRRLRSAGIRVDVGVLAAEAAEVLAPYLIHTRRKRPYVIAKWAQSLDGKLATAGGDSRWISCDTSRRRAHLLRARVDAVIVGRGTVDADDPMLTARDVPIKRQALRIVLDSRLRISERSTLVRTAAHFPTLIAASPLATRSKKARRLRGRGVDLLPCPKRGKQLAPDKLLARLAARGAVNVMVEGGPAVLRSFFRAGLVDEAYVFVAPILLGGPATPGVIGGQGLTRVADAPLPRRITLLRSGRDALFHLVFTDPQGI